MLSSALNPDRATLNFLNAYSEEVRNEGERLQKEGAVTQIFGNHLFIQGRVETRTGVYRTSLRLQGNRWYGSATAEDEDVAGACLIATMVERMYRGANMPESPNELNEIPLSDILEDKLGRDLDSREADFVTKLEKRYRRFAIEQEIHDHDLVRLNPRWEITGYDALDLWPTPPRNILEFWNYIAYAFTRPTGISGFLSGRNSSYFTSSRCLPQSITGRLGMASSRKRSTALEDAMFVSSVMRTLPSLHT